MGRFFLFVVIAAAVVYALACASRRVFLAFCLFKVGSMFKVNSRIYLSQMSSGMASGKDLRRCDTPTKRFPACTDETWEIYLGINELMKLVSCPR